jgi:ATP-dependent Clp protease ATP-binding subunit ClpB
LKRVIQKEVQDPLAEMILAGEIADGQTVAVSADRSGITIDGRAVGRRRAVEEEHDEPGTVVRFPKGA